MSIEEHPLFLSQLKRHEGTKRDRQGRHKAYRCASGALTIGWGHNLDARPVDGLGARSAIGDAEAELLLLEDCAVAAQELDWRMAWWRELDEPRAAVLLNMAFNMGIGRLLGFRRTLEAVREGRFDDARAAMLHSRWAGQVKRRAVELAEQMRTGRWQGLRLNAEAELEVSDPAHPAASPEACAEAAHPSACAGMCRHPAAGPAASPEAQTGEVCASAAARAGTELPAEGRASACHAGEKGWDCASCAGTCHAERAEASACPAEACPDAAQPAEVCASAKACPDAAQPAEVCA